ncbi:MAG: hypothetical protein AB1657_04265 [Candidatus Micrarchaeota archaeon]
MLGTGNRKRETGNRKGYATGVDFVLSILIFSIVLAYSIGSYYYYLGEYRAVEARKNLEVSALALTDTLLKSPGIPGDWEAAADWEEWMEEEEEEEEWIPTGLESIGLVRRANVLEPAKVFALDMMDYNYSREVLGIGADYFLYITTVGGITVMEKGVRMENASVISVRRMALYNGTYAWVTLDVYG